MATITKRGSSFKITVSLGYGADGRQIRKTTTFKPPQNVTDKKAEKLALAFAVEFEKDCQGRTSLNENMRFNDLVTWYFANYAPNKLKPVTIYTYERQLKSHIQPTFGNAKLKDFSAAKLTKFFGEVELSPATCKKLFTILESVFTQAVKIGFLRESPCKNVILPKQEKTKKKSLTDIQTKELLKMIEEYSQLNTILKVLLYTGARSGEILGLKWENIDFSKHLIHITQTLAYIKGKRFLQTPKTKTSVRYIGMSAALEKILLEHKQEQDKIKAFVGASYVYPEMVFATSTGNYVDRSFTNRQFKKLIKDTDFSFASLHTLRHCNATILINSGIDLKIVSEHLGHSGVSVTADIYTDVLSSTKQKVADLVALNLE